jgi:hypothetical protein
MRIHFDFSKGETNYHGPNFAVIKGPKLVFRKLTVVEPSLGFRLIFYKPSGKCLYFDMYVDRRSKP